MDSSSLLSQNQTYNYKIVLLGESCVGKTSIGERFVKDSFSEYQESTIGAAFLTKSVEMDEDTIIFEIWDTAGQERYHSLAPMYYRGAKSAIIVFDVTDENSFKKAKKWVEEIQLLDIFIALVGNKCDLEYKISKDTILEYANNNDLFFIETSAKQNTNINTLFDTIAKKLPREVNNYSSIKNIESNIKIKKKCC